MRLMHCFFPKGARNNERVNFWHCGDGWQGRKGRHIGNVPRFRNAARLPSAAF